MNEQKININVQKRLTSHGILTYIAVGLVFSAISIFLTLYFMGYPTNSILRNEISQYEKQFKEFEKRLVEYDKVLKDIEYRDDKIYRSMFGVSPISPAVRKAGYGGTERYSKFNGYSKGEIMKSIAIRLDNLSGRMYTETLSLDELNSLANEKADFLMSVPAIMPVRETDLRAITSHYGTRTDPFYNVNKRHKGIDFAMPIGNDVIATGKGTVCKVVDKTINGYGKHIIIDHGFGYKTLYAHLSSTFVKTGQKINRGQIIGLVGNTGKSSGPHLHYEVLKDDINKNPIHYFFKDISPEQYNILIKNAEQPGKSMD